MIRRQQTTFPNRYEQRLADEHLHLCRRLAAFSHHQSTPGRIWDEAHDEAATSEEIARALIVADQHGMIVTTRKRRPIGLRLECFCGSPIVYSRGLVCEFDPWPHCACNPCLLDAESATGRPRVYCSTKCKDRMRLAVNRAKRRADGKTTRAVDDLADRIAELVYAKPCNKQRGHLCPKPVTTTEA